MPGWRVLAIGVGVALFAGCDSSNDESSDTVAPTSSVTTTNQTTIPASAPTSQSDNAGSIPLPDAVGTDLQAAQDTMQAAGFYYLTSHDATGQGRNQVLDRNWTVCDQAPAAGSPTAPDATIDFGAPGRADLCPCAAELARARSLVTVTSAACAPCFVAAETGSCPSRHELSPLAHDPDHRRPDDTPGGRRSRLRPAELPSGLYL